MKKRIILAAFLATGLAVGCQKAEPSEPVFPVRPIDPTEKSLEPAPCNNNVVAHRCGGKEINAPDNSIQALKYAMSIGCLAAETDMYYTKDNNIIIHHGSDGLVNGLHPSQHTVEEIRAKGRLSNGEQIPTLEDFLDVLCVKGSCTKLWIETKNITNTGLSGTEQEQAIINGVNRAIEIIKEKKAEKFVEFNGTGRTAVFQKIQPIARSAGFNISIAYSGAASELKRKQWGWASYDASKKSADEIKSIVADYKANEVELTLYCMDTDALRAAVLPYKSSVKGLMTNYPKKLMISQGL